MAFGYYKFLHWNYKSRVGAESQRPLITIALEEGDGNCEYSVDDGSGEKWRNLMCLEGGLNDREA
jgi:hypothetical protein